MLIKKIMMKKIQQVLFLAIFISSISTNSFAKLITEEEEKYKGSFDVGATISNGNSKEQSIQSNLNFDYHFTKEVSNVFRSRAENKKLNRVRTKEEYFTNNQTRQDIGEKNFRFVELEFVSDRYGGYNYRISETAGFGRKLINDKDLKWLVQSSIGLRQSKLINDEKNNSFIVRAGTTVNAKINDTLSFEEIFDVSTDQNATIFRSDANLKIRLSKKLYFKLGVLIERTTNVPVGTKNSDVTTALKLGYDF